MSLQPSDFRVLYSTSVGPGNVAPQPIPALSLGGYASQTSWNGGTLGDLFGNLTTAAQVAGLPDHRAVYVLNYNPSITAFDLNVYIPTQPSGGCAYDVGVDPTPISTFAQTSPQGLTIPDPYTAPPGVVFTSPTTYDSGVQLGNLVAGTGRQLWIRRRPLINTATPAVDTTNIIIECPT